MGKGRAAVAASSSSSSRAKDNMEEETSELQDLGALAQQMEEQLMAEFEALLASRRMQGAGGKPSSSASSTSRVGSRKPMGEGGAQQQQEARDAVYWKHMYEQMRDLRETEAERMLGEVTRHAEEREKALMDLVAHLEEKRGKGSSGGSSAAGRPSTAISSRRQQRDVRLSDVSVAGTAPMMDMDDDEVAVPEARSSSSSSSSSSSAETAALSARVAELEGKMATLKRVLMAYQRLTSLCVSLEKAPKDGARWAEERVSTLRCTAVNHVHKKALEFQLKMNCDEEENYKQDAIFKPLRDKKSLPSCMQEEVAIETQQCPILFRTILGTLYSSGSSGKKKE